MHLLNRLEGDNAQGGQVPDISREYKGCKSRLPAADAETGQ